MLLNEGADVDASAGGMSPTPLFLAVEAGRVAVVKTLLAHGASLTWEDLQDWATALDLTPSNPVLNSKEIYNLLLSRVNLEAAGESAELPSKSEEFSAEDLRAWGGYDTSSESIAETIQKHFSTFILLFSKFFFLFFLTLFLYNVMIYIAGMVGTTKTDQTKARANARAAPRRARARAPAPAPEPEPEPEQAEPEPEPNPEPEPEPEPSVSTEPRELEPESAREPEPSPAPEPEPSPDEAFEETKGAELDPTVRALLVSLDLTALEPIFADHMIDADALPLLTTEDLVEDMGLPLAAARSIVEAMRAVSEASAKKLVVQDVFDDIARHQAVVEAELADHRAELERLRIRRDEVPDFACPITTELMKDPVFAADGHTYERCAIALWFERKNTSPVTNAPLRNADLIPNHAMKSMIAEFLEQSRALVEA
ncbi:ubiquitin-protein transferase [Aureococcus anophagefferens]|nr:ubiquitin-protein transferase [Aureococcus anophagefferens]